MSLEDAVRFAEMDGIVMIHDLNLGKGFEQYYLDTARNREILTHYAMSEENTSEREVFRRKLRQIPDVVDVYTRNHIKRTFWRSRRLAATT